MEVLQWPSMDDLDFSAPASAPKPAPKPAPKAAEPSPYDPQLALRFFQIAGETESVAAGKTLFAENDKHAGFFSKGARVYLLLEGQVALTLKGKPLHLVLPGETFGEMAVISDAPRSATATALKNARVLALDQKRFLASLQQVPEFALMLLGVQVQQLRRSVERVMAARPGPLPPRADGGGLDVPTLKELQKALGDPAPKPMKAGEAIVTKGALGVSLYVVTHGQVAIALDGCVIERVGPGGIFGESALLGPTQRAASATAETDGAWLPVSREEFLAVIKTRPAIGIALLRSMSERMQHVSGLLGG